MLHPLDLSRLIITILTLPQYQCSIPCCHLCLYLQYHQLWELQTQLPPHPHRVHP